MFYKLKCCNGLKLHLGKRNPYFKSSNTVTCGKVGLKKMIQIIVLFFFQVYAINDLNMTGEISTETKEAPAGGMKCYI